MMRFNQLTSWLDWIMSLHTKEIDLGLSRVKAFAKQLSLTSFQCPVIIVGGTNGKGSCVTLLTAMYRQAGYRVGSYTSPHLWRYNERICIDQISVADSDICDAFDKIDQLGDAACLTYFEWGTLAALHIFQQHVLDVVILEVGLGGRLDAVNCIDADVAVITSVELDHQAWLGETREAIGYEKAGIFRAKHPAILGFRDVPASILAYANSHRVPLVRLGQAFDYESISATQLSWYSQHSSYPCINNPKRWHASNIATSLAVIEQLRTHLPVSQAQALQGIRQATLAGRYQCVQLDSVPVYFDVAHNPAAAQALADYWQQEIRSGQRLAVVGMLQDKDIKGTLAPLIPHIDQWYLGTLCVPRGATGALLAQYLAALNVESDYYAEFMSVPLAFRAAIANAGRNDKILVFGSFYTISCTLESKGVEYG